MGYNPYGSTAPVTYGMLLYQADQIRNTVNSAYSNVNAQVVQSARSVAQQVDMRYSQLDSTIRQTASAITSANASLYSQINNSVASQVNSVRTTVVQSENNVKNAVNAAANQINNTVLISEQRLQNRLNDTVTVLAERIVTGDKLIMERLSQLAAIPGTVINGIQSQLMSVQSNIINNISGQINQTEQDIINVLSSRIQNNSSQINQVQSSLQTKLDMQYSGIQQSLSRIQQTTEQIDTSAGLPDFGEILGLPFKLVFDMFIGFGNALGEIPRDAEKAITKMREILRKLESNEYHGYQEFVDDINNLGIAGGVLNTLWDAGKFLYMITFGLMQSYGPFIENIKTLSQSQANSTLMSNAEVAAFYTRFGKDLDFFKSYLNKLGYSDSDIEKMRTLTTQILPENVARYAWMNKKIDETTHDSILEQNGYSAQAIEIIKRTYQIIPPLSDLITMAVREAFSPAIADKFGQYEDYPEKLTPFAAQHGLNEDWSKAYWASHWALPSPSQGFEMLHRGIIDKDTLKLLLRALDIMPFWRDKVIDLSYSTLRLVDIRRFYELGTIDEQEMYEEYLARGYDEKRAKWATQWTIDYIAQGSEQEKTERRLLSQSVIVKAYNTGRLSRLEAVHNLKLLKYDDNTANLILDVYASKVEIEREDEVIDDNKKRMVKLASDGYAKRLLSKDEAGDILVSAGYTGNQVTMELDWIDYEVETLLKANIVKYFTQLYSEFQIDRDTIVLTLSGYGFAQSEIDHILIEHDLVREVRTRQPTLETIIKWFKLGILDKQQFIDELKGLGFGNKYIVYYLMEYAQEDFS